MPLLLKPLYMLFRIFYLETGDVDGHQVLANLGPFDCSGTRSCHVEDLGPQTANGNAVKMRGKKTILFNTVE